MVERAVQAISHEWIKRGAKTALTEMFIERTGAKNLEALIEGIDLKTYCPDASWAPIIFDAANHGDRVAQEIIAWSGHESGESACAVIRQLEIENEEFEVILVGSVFDGGELYIGPLRATIHKFALKARLVKLEAPPVVGGIVLGMQRTGIETASIHERLIQTTKQLIADR